MPTLAENHYGKSRIRLVKVVRHATHHDLYEWTLGVYLTGDFDTCYTAGDNSTTMATDTMKNTVYLVARAGNATTIEAFAHELARFLQDRNPQATSIRITAEAKMWQRIKVDEEKVHPTAFLQRGPDVDTTTVVLTPGAPAHITSGIRGLVILKTAQSAFHGFLRDELTTLPESTDRLLGTEATIDWIYTTPAPGTSEKPDFARTRRAVMDTLLTTFANHDSLSVQHTLYAMAEAALSAHPELLELTLTMPNRHNIPANLGALGSDNPNTIFIPTDEPHGHIQARITR